MKVIFYGLFMDEKLLAEKGIIPGDRNVGFVDGYTLRIGERATLVRNPDSRAYGVVMDVAADQVEELYADKSVADYVPEPVNVELMDGSKVAATCYNLPADKITGTNKKYAEALLNVASNLGFPDSYLEEIRNAQE